MSFDIKIKQKGNPVRYWVRMDQEAICSLEAGKDYYSICWDGVEKKAEEIMNFLRDLFFKFQVKNIRISLYYKKKETSRSFRQAQINTSRISFDDIKIFKNIIFIRIYTEVADVTIDIVTPENRIAPQIGVVVNDNHGSDNTPIPEIISKLFQFNNKDNFQIQKGFSSFLKQHLGSYVK